MYGTLNNYYLIVRLSGKEVNIFRIKIDFSEKGVDSQYFSK
jgi:hypothetical protein